MTWYKRRDLCADISTWMDHRRHMSDVTMSVMDDLFLLSPSHLFGDSWFGRVVHILSWLWDITLKQFACIAVVCPFVDTLMIIPSPL